MSLTSGLVGKNPPSSNTPSYELLDAVYSKSCVILEDLATVFTGVYSPLPSIGVPLIGFEYKPESGIELLKFRWSQYPYLNKAKLTFAAVKEATDFSVTVISPVTVGSPLIAGIALRTAMVTLLEKYCSRGGKFTVITLWGTKRHCVLTDLVGIGEDGTMDGTLFKMSFNQPNYDLSGATNSMTQFMQTITNGGAV